MVQYRILLSNIHIVEIKTFILNYLDKLVSYCAVLGHIWDFYPLCYVNKVTLIQHVAAEYVGHWTVVQKGRQLLTAVISAAQFLLPLDLMMVPIILLCIILLFITSFLLVWKNTYSFHMILLFTSFHSSQDSFRSKHSTFLSVLNQ